MDEDPACRSTAVPPRLSGHAPGLRTGRHAAAAAASSGRPRKSITVWTSRTSPTGTPGRRRSTRASPRRPAPPGPAGAVTNQLPQLVAPQRSGKLPDVIGGIPLAQRPSAARQKLLNTGLAGEIVTGLEGRHFARHRAEADQEQQRQLAVPSDARRRSSGTARTCSRRPACSRRPPTTPPARRPRPSPPEAVRHHLATDPADVVHLQTFESLASATTASWSTDRQGTLDVAACEHDLEPLRALSSNTRPQGTQTVDTHPGDLLRRPGGHGRLVDLPPRRAGRTPQRRAAHLPQCTSDPRAWRRTAGSSPRSRVRTARSGGDVRRDRLVGLGRPEGTRRPRRSSSSTCSPTATARLGDGTGGQVPASDNGDTGNPNKFIDAWNNLPAGVDTKKPLPRSTTPPRIDAMLTGAIERIDRWAIPQGQGEPARADERRAPHPQGVAGMANGESATDPPRRPSARSQRPERS